MLILYPKLLNGNILWSCDNCDRTAEVSKLPDGKMNWEEWFNPSNIKLDEPNIPVIKMAQLFAEDGFNIVILSGRSDKTILTTKSWLIRNRVPFHKLVMRPHKTMNFIPDEVLKKDMLDKHIDIDDIFMVVDDRQKVVDMWRDLGLTCFQVAPGDF